MKKFTAILLAVVMVFALGASAFAADTTPVTTKAVDTTLSVTVDYTIEGLYFDGTTLKSSATNGYYPFNFSFIVSDRTAVGSITVSNGGSFAKTARLRAPRPPMVWSRCPRPPLPR